jgi:electron transfer flavoprotein alpha subunit
MGILVVAEHDNRTMKAATLNTVTAALAIGTEVDVLVAGQDAGVVAGGAGAITGINKVLHADAEHYLHPLAEELAPLLVKLAPAYTHLLAPATTFGKNLMPRVAALLDGRPGRRGND